MELHGRYEMATYKELADEYAKRLSSIRKADERIADLEKILDEIQRFTVDNKPISARQIEHMLKTLKESLKELGFDESILALEYYNNTGLEELAKSSSTISNDEILALMSMVSRGPKP